MAGAPELHLRLCGHASGGPEGPAGHTLPPQRLCRLPSQLPGARCLRPRPPLAVLLGVPRLLLHPVPAGDALAQARFQSSARRPRLFAHPCACRGLHATPSAASTSTSLNDDVSFPRGPFVQMPACSAMSITSYCDGPPSLYLLPAPLLRLRFSASVLQGPLPCRHGGFVAFLKHLASAEGAKLGAKERGRIPPPAPKTIKPARRGRSLEEDKTCSCTHLSKRPP